MKFFERGKNIEEPLCRHNNPRRECPECKFSLEEALRESDAVLGRAIIEAMGKGHPAPTTEDISLAERGVAKLQKGEKVSEQYPELELRDAAVLGFVTRRIAEQIAHLKTRLEGIRRWDPRRIYDILDMKDEELKRQGLPFTEEDLDRVVEEAGGEIARGSKAEKEKEKEGEGEKED